LSNHLPDVFKEVTKEHRFSPGDMPNVEQYREKLQQFKDFRHFPLWNPRQMADLDDLIKSDVPQLMARIGGVSASGLKARAESPPAQAGVAPAARAGPSWSRSSCYSPWSRSSLPWPSPRK